MNEQKGKPIWAYYSIMIAIAAIPLILVVIYAVIRSDAILDNSIRYALEHTSEESRREIYKLFAQHTPGRM